MDYCSIPRIFSIEEYKILSCLLWDGLAYISCKKIMFSVASIQVLLEGT